MREIKPYPIVDKLINMFDSWLKHRQEIREMREFDIGKFARVAHELVSRQTIWIHSFVEAQMPSKNFRNC